MESKDTAAQSFLKFGEKKLKSEKKLSKSVNFEKKFSNWIFSTMRAKQEKLEHTFESKSSGDVKSHFL